MKKIIPLDDYNGRIELGDVVGSVTRTWGNSALRNGWKIIEIYDDEREWNKNSIQDRSSPAG